MAGEIVTVVFVTGHSRSGTSLTAGLLRSQGVWFGPCCGPAEINKKGFLESLFVKDRIRRKHFHGFQKDWDNYRASLLAGGLWGVKTGPQYYHLFEQYQPLIVVTDRPEIQIKQSRKRANFHGTEVAMRNANRNIAKLPKHLKVKPEEFAAGNYQTLLPVLSKLGLKFHRESADKWVQPELWHG